jgi:formylglycine-generating enzyme required for sulfatase activity
MKQIRLLLVLAALGALVGCPEPVTPPGDYSSASIGILKYVPAGTFQRDSDPANTSTVAAFHMSETEITRAQFTAVTGLADPTGCCSTGTDDPVQVSWYRAIVFCNMLSMAEGLTPVYTISSSTDPASANWGPVPTVADQGWDAATMNWSANGYRLPTEMEWMWAAMGATGGTTGFLKEFAGDPNPANPGDDINSYAWWGDVAGNSGSTTHPVGTKLANELGLYDMSGNLNEWCWDWWDNTYPVGSVTDYTGVPPTTLRVVRGGDWYFDATYATVANRGSRNPEVQDTDFGFRVVRR